MRQPGVESDAAGLARQPLRLAELVAIEMDQAGREQHRRAVLGPERFVALQGEDLLVHGDGRRVGSDADVFAQRVPQALELPDRLAALAVAQVSADQLTVRLLVGRVQVEYPSPQPAALEHGHQLVPQALARRAGPRLVPVGRQQASVVVEVRGRRARVTVPGGQGRAGGGEEPNGIDVGLAVPQPQYAELRTERLVGAHRSRA
jgi:hypothetical protein